MKKKTNGEEDIKPDLKHDTMEFSAATDGDDRLDTDDAYYEEEGIDADELAALEDDPASVAAALNEAEHDREIDIDKLTDEDWTDDLPDNNEEEDEGEDEDERNSR
jgi:hypothetical protein